MAAQRVGITTRLLLCTVQYYRTIYHSNFQSGLVALERFSYSAPLLNDLVTLQESIPIDLLYSIL